MSATTGPRRRGRPPKAPDTVVTDRVASSWPTLTHRVAEVARAFEAGDAAAHTMELELLVQEAVMFAAPFIELRAVSRRQAISVERDASRYQGST